MSATPVREAMLEFVREQPVEIVANKGFRVSTVSEADMDQMTQTRLPIEPRAARQATPVIPENHLPALQEMADAVVTGAGHATWASTPRRITPPTRI